MTPKPRGFTGIEADVMKTTLANISASKRTASGSGTGTVYKIEQKRRGKGGETSSAQRSNR